MTIFKYMCIAYKYNFLRLNCGKEFLGYSKN